SGYALSSQWGKRKSKNYLKKFEISHDKGIKTVILPQSIGPFNFGEDSLKMNEMLYETLSKVNIIMPREREGMESLSKLGIKNNVFYSPDLVLT
ncbi:TPA: polysaccharide pyruvyl transferase family protein, partial [Enterococcus faecium]